MPKPNKQAIIDAIIKLIEQGKSWKQSSTAICGKFRFSEKTFDKYWKIANEQHGQLQVKARMAADIAYIKASANAAVEAVMSKAERQKILSEIARGTVWVKVTVDDDGTQKDVNILVETTERLKAIAEINKMEGDYAETSIKLKGDKENPLFDLSNATVIFK